MVDWIGLLFSAHPGGCSGCDALTRRGRCALVQTVILLLGVIQSALAKPISAHPGGCSGCDALTRRGRCDLVQTVIKSLCVGVGAN